MIPCHANFHWSAPSCANAVLRCSNGCCWMRTRQTFCSIASGASQVCQRYGLAGVERRVCLAVGMARLQQGSLAAALRWLGRADDQFALDTAARGLVQSVAQHAASPSSSTGGFPRFHQRVDQAAKDRTRYFCSTPLAAPSSSLLATWWNSCTVRGGLEGWFLKRHGAIVYRGAGEDFGELGGHGQCGRRRIREGQRAGHFWPHMLLHRPFESPGAGPQGPCRGTLPATLKYLLPTCIKSCIAQGTLGETAALLCKLFAKFCCF